MSAHGGELAVAQLLAEGVDALFALNGGHVAPIFDACLDRGLRIVDVRHEAAAVHMAHAYARARRAPAAACVTAGPGVTNTATAMATATVNLAPLVLVGGKVPVPQFGLGALQDVDQTGLLAPIAKSTATVLHTGRIPEVLSAAFRTARRPPQGPCFVEIPTDVLRGESPGAVADALAVPAPDRPAAPPPELVEQVAAALAGSRRPVIVAGSGVWWSGASASLAALARRLGIPLLTTSLGRGVLPADDPLNLYAARSRLLAGADLVLVLGTRFNYVMNYGRPPRLPAAATIVQVDAAPGELDRNRVADIGILADIGAFLAALGDAAPPPPPIDRAWRDDAAAAHRRAVAATRAEAAGDAAPVHPLRLCADLADVAPPGTRFVADGGDVLSFARLVLHPDGPGRFLDPGPFGCLGTGLPFANGVKLAFPDDPVVCVTGDGALGLGLMELDTAARHDLAVVVVVSNNAAWGIERNSQIADYGPDRVIGTELADRRFDRVAEALGCQGERVTDPAALKGALQRAFDAGRPALVDVVTDPAAASPDLRRGLARVPDRSPLDWPGREET